MSFTTPVLLIAWRRPETIRRVIEAIRPIAPTRMFLACDGASPDRTGEEEQVRATQAVLEAEIDWPCVVKRRYSLINQGCRLGVSNAISWFFKEVDEGIIIEDDCVAHPDFLPFSANLLDRYRDDTRVWCISGNNFQGGEWRGDGSYYFSRYMHCWGWASWRRCWQQYDRDLKGWPTLKQSGLMTTIFQDPGERDFWTKTWDRLLHENEPDTWDYQWSFTCFANGGLVALPNVNLVDNIGYGADATHTIEKVYATATTEGIKQIIHPTWILRDDAADRKTYHDVFCYGALENNEQTATRSEAIQSEGRLSRMLKYAPRRVKATAKKWYFGHS